VVALMTGDTTVKICRWRRRFPAQGLVGLEDQPRGNQRGQTP
jgi:hypothetical protein